MKICCTHEIPIAQSIHYHSGDGKHGQKAYTKSRCDDVGNRLAWRHNAFNGGAGCNHSEIDTNV